MDTGVGFSVPAEYQSTTYLDLFRRAKTIASLEVMNVKQVRDIEELSIKPGIKKIYSLEVYRAYVQRYDEIEDGKHTFHNPLGKALAESLSADVNVKGKPVVSIGKAERADPPVSLTGSMRFTEAERALARELSNLSI